MTPAKPINWQRVAEIKPRAVPQIIGLPENVIKLTDALIKAGYGYNAYTVGGQLHVTKGLKVNGVAMAERRERLAKEGWE